MMTIPKNHRAILWILAILAPPLSVALCGYHWQAAITLLLWIGFPPLFAFPMGWFPATILACTAVYRHLAELDGDSSITPNS